MSPAIRLGADRLLLISLRHVGREPKMIERASAPRRIPSRCSSWARRSTRCSSIHTEYDLMRMKRNPLLLEAATDAFRRFVSEEMMNHELVRCAGAPLRRIQAVHIRPSEDIARSPRSSSPRRNEGRRLIRAQAHQRLAAGEGRARERPVVLPLVRRRLRGD